MTPPFIVLLAAGGHGRVVLDALLSLGAQVGGVLDPQLRVGDQVLGIPVLGGDAWLQAQPTGHCLLANGAGATPSASLRRRLFQEWTARGFSFVCVRHRSAVVGRGVMLAPDCQLMAGAVVQPGTSVGTNAVVNTRASIDHDCRIGAHAFIGPGAVLCGGVQIAAGAFVGAGAIVLPGVRIGEDAVVGAGATVTRDVPDGVLVTGCPAAARRA